LDELEIDVSMAFEFTENEITYHNKQLEQIQNNAFQIDDIIKDEIQIEIKKIHDRLTNYNKTLNEILFIFLYFVFHY